MKGADPQALRVVAEHPADAITHLTGRLVRERDGEDRTRVNVVHFNQSRESRGEDSRLSRAGSSEYEQWPVGAKDCLCLGGVESGEEAVRSGGHHGRKIRPRADDYPIFSIPMYGRSTSGIVMLPSSFK